MYNVQQVNAGNSNSRVKALQDAMAGIAIEHKPTFYDGLAEAVRLGGKAAFGRAINDYTIEADLLLSDMFFSSLDELEKINNG